MKLWLKTSVFLAVCVIVFLIHRFVIPFHKFNDHPEYVEFSYLYNLIFSVSVIFLLWLISFLDSDFLGFINMIFGVLKIILFVYLVHKLQFSLERKDFFTIFAPYALGQGMEIFWIRQYLKEVES